MKHLPGEDSPLLQPQRYCAESGRRFVHHVRKCLHLTCDRTNPCKYDYVDRHTRGDRMACSHVWFDDGRHLSLSRYRTTRLCGPTASIGLDASCESDLGLGDETNRRQSLGLSCRYKPPRYGRPWTLSLQLEYEYHLHTLEPT